MPCFTHNKNGIGVELDAKYYKLAIKRLRKELRLDQLTFEDALALDSAEDTTEGNTVVATY